MPGIYLTAICTTALALGLFQLSLRTVPGAASSRLLWSAFLLALPLQPLVFYAVRLPLDHLIVAHLGRSAPAYPWLASFYAPLTEEPAKLLPLLLLPALRRDLRRENCVRYALAIGIGFAIGEMWFVAERVARVPALAALPFYQLGGYVSERLMTCAFHTAFVAVALWAFRRAFVAGELGAMALHWLGNLPITFMALNLGGLGHARWAMLVQAWLGVYFLGALALLAGLACARGFSLRSLIGRSVCLTCGTEFDPSLLGMNLGTRRYERCPHCRQWQWTKIIRRA